MAESKFKSWMRLIRVAALPTAIADVWLGASVIEQLPSVRTLILSATSLLLYSGGMILNDLNDIEVDHFENPTRPLPSGAISPRTAGVAGFLMLGLGVFISYFASRQPWPMYTSAVLVYLILLYNFNGKARKHFGPALMALCRAFNVYLGVSLIPLYLFVSDMYYMLVALPIFLYILGVTYLARREADPDARVQFHNLILPILAVLIVPVFTLVELSRLPEMIPEFSRIMIAGVLVIGGVAAYSMVRRLKGLPVREGVGRLLVGIIPLQAFVAFGHLRPLAAAAIFLLIVPAFLLRKMSHVT